MYVEAVRVDHSVNLLTVELSHHPLSLRPALLRPHHCALQQHGDETSVDVTIEALDDDCTSPRSDCMAV